MDRVCHGVVSKVAQPFLVRDLSSGFDFCLLPPPLDLLEKKLFFIGRDLCFCVCFFEREEEIGFRGLCLCPPGAFVSHTAGGKTFGFGRGVYLDRPFSFVRGRGLVHVEPGPLEL